jgi:hypothetical protein
MENANIFGSICSNGKVTIWNSYVKPKPYQHFNLFNDFSEEDKPNLQVISALLLPIPSKVININII